MRGDKAFFDTNLIVYAFAKDDPRAEAAEALLAAGGVISVQILNEFAAVASRKLGMAWDDVLAALDAILVLCPSPVPLTIETLRLALGIAKRHKYHIYDALVIASALEASCATLYSEDLQNGQVIGGLTIRNPFQKG
ncbi:MAG: PIN domain-containing protein [Bryobacteraceae bacterium]